MTGKSFVKGAVVLSVAGILAKCLGALYRIPFARIGSDECIAIYGLVYPLYNLLLALSTAGIPLAISKLVAEYEEEGKSGISMRILKVSLLLLSAVGAAVAVLIFVKADWLAANLLHEPKAAWSLRAIAPAMIFTCVQAVFRGYFQGLQQMVPTALSQITEQFMRVGVIFIALFTLMPFGDEIMAAGASSGASIGGMIALCVIFVIYLRYRKNNREKVICTDQNDDKTIANKQLIGKVLALAIPISIGSLVLPIMQTIDSVMVLPRLEAGGMSHLEAMTVYGYLSMCVLPIINLPFILTTAISASLVPNISEALAMGEKDQVHHNFRNAMQLAILIVLPATVGLMTLARPIMDLLFAKPGAGVAMLWSAGIVLAVGLYQISAATLQGMGKAMIPMYSLLLVALIKVILTYSLTAVPSLGIRGAALGSVVGFAVAALNNIYQASRRIGWQWLSLKYHIIKPLISVVAMAVVVLGCYHVCFGILNSNGVATLLSIIVGGAAYFAVLLMIGGVSIEIIRKVPKLGNKLAGILLKLKLVRE